MRSRIEGQRFFRTLRRTRVFSNNVNARRLHVHALNIILSIFQIYCNWLRYHKGGRRRAGAFGRKWSYLTNISRASGHD